MASTTRLVKFIPYREGDRFVNVAPQLRAKVTPINNEWRLEIEAEGPVADALKLAIERAALAALDAATKGEA